MSATRCRVVVFAAAGAVMLNVGNAGAFRMIQNQSTVRTSSGFRVRCDDAAGFAHWNQASLGWRLNPAGQGGGPGVASALQAALAAWNGVTPAGYSLAYDGTTNGGFVTDGINAVSWGSGNGCTGGCLALTALVLGQGQVIQESDVTFNDAYDWKTNGSDYDVQAIATHELGHTLGIHHTEITKPRNRPTMYATYFGLDMRTLENDDRDALNCAWNHYPPGGMVIAAMSDESGESGEPSADVKLASRVISGGSTLRWAMREPGVVRLEVFDVAGRRLATLVNGPRAAGEHEVAWNGETRTGVARRGVYFARIVTRQGRGRATIVLGR